MMERTNDVAHPELDYSVEAREAFFLSISLIQGRPLGLGQQIERSINVGKFHHVVPMLDDALRQLTMAEFGFKAGMARIGLIDGSLEGLYELYRDWYARAEAELQRR